MKKGKIACCTVAIREEVNRRLLDGERGAGILSWLNAQGAVKRVLGALFEGKPVSKSNLGRWKEGGYTEWLEHREQREQAGEMALKGLRTPDDGTTDDGLRAK